MRPTVRSMENAWLDRLRAGDIVVLDGAIGGELRRRGVDLSGEVWSALAARDHTGVLREIHADYIRAGADIVTTNTFSSARYVLESAGLGHEFAEINRQAVAAALAARTDVAERPVAIAGSISCFPPRFDPMRYPERDEERNAYRELAAFLAGAGVDLLAVEMIQDIAHGALALDAALETGLPVCLGLSVRSSTDGLSAYDDPARPFESLLGPLLERGPSVVAIMHTPVDVVGEALDAVVGAGWDGPLGAYPELGAVPGLGAPRGTMTSPIELAAAAAGWVDAGVRLLGGCCGAGPEHIAALAAIRDHGR
jgi:S-methylmethionine-dependent homocysteine/selenocysteine methylase